MPNDPIIPEDEETSSKAMQQSKDQETIFSFIDEIIIETKN